MVIEMPGTQLLYQIQIDYTNVGEDKKLPYVVELDLENSILAPVHGEHQRFCYQITGVGEDIPLYSELKQFVLDFGDIPKDHITNISVKIDEEEQPVTFGEDGNVVVMQPNQTESAIQTHGLKFNFGCKKASGLMTISFDLTQVYPLGYNPVYLIGDEMIATGLALCGPICKKTKTCPSIVYQNASICAPVKVSFFAKAGATQTTPVGLPVISRATQACCGKPNGNCKFTMSQKLCIAVPVEFGARTKVGKPSVLPIASLLNDDPIERTISLEEQDFAESEVNESSSINVEQHEEQQVVLEAKSDVEMNSTNATPRVSHQTDKSDASNVKGLFNPHFRRRF